MIFSLFCLLSFILSLPFFSLSRMHTSSPHRPTVSWLQTQMLQDEMQEQFLPSGNSSVAWLQGGTKPPPAAALQERSSTLPQTSVTHSSLNLVKTVVYEHGQSFSYSWMGKKVKTENLPFSRSHIICECCIENMLPVTFCKWLNMGGQKTTWGSSSKFSASWSLHLGIKIDFACNC